MRCIQYTLKIRQLALAFTVVIAACFSNAYADESCEAYISQLLEEAIAQAAEQGEQDTSVQGFMELMERRFDVEKLARFTLGRYAPSANAQDFDDYRDALRRYLAAEVTQRLMGAQGITAEVIRSVDRSARDCVVEAVIQSNAREDVVLLWRVIFNEEHHSVVDLGLRDAGNTLWLAIELRAQFLAQLDQSNGELRALTHDLRNRAPSD